MPDPTDEITTCEYSLIHQINKVPATCSRALPALGEIQMCGACAAFYDRMSDPNRHVD